MKRVSNANCLSFDLGASGGRAFLGILEDGALRLKVLRRFPNAPVCSDGRLRWNVAQLWRQMRGSLRCCAEGGLARPDSIGISAWGVDFGLIGRDGELIADPLCYRDALTEGMDRRIARNVGRRRLYRLSGRLPDRVSTLTQLMAMRSGGGAAALAESRALLMVPDLFRYFLTGEISAERTAAATSQLVGIHTGRWSPTLCRIAGVPRRILPSIVNPGTIVGRLTASLSAETGLEAVPVAAVAGHDSASAAAAAPHVDPGSAFISCGTWAILGVHCPKPILRPAAAKARFVNLFGLESMLFVKACAGLHLLECLRRSLAAGDKPVSHARLMDEAAAARPFGVFLDLNAPCFFSGEAVESNARRFLRGTGQKSPGRRGALFRAILESVAWSFREAIRDIQDLIRRPLRRICLMGGGSRNRLLAQMTADATRLEVVAGPAEATTVGNVLAQTLAAGKLRSASDFPELVRASFVLRTYRPIDPAAWDREFPRYIDVRRRSIEFAGDSDE